MVLRSSFEESLHSINYEKKHALVADVVRLHEFHNFGSRSGAIAIYFSILRLAYMF